MKFFFIPRILPVFLAVSLIAGTKAGAQGFGISATNSPNPVILNNSLTYTINVTNQTGLLLTNFYVTNTLSAPVQFLSAGSSYATNSAVTNATGLVFTFGQFTNGDTAQMIMILQPQSLGFLTNFIVVASTQVTNTVATNIVAQVITAQADLGVSMTGPAQAVITNDLMTYGVTVTNSGPDAAPNVVLTNTLPPGVILKGVSPMNQAYSVVASNLIFSLGTMANGGSVNLQFTVEPTNAGVLAFSASVSAPGLLDTNTANNSAGTNIMVIDYLPGTLHAVTNSAQTINRQNGLTEQSILLSNTGTTNVPAARIVVTGLTNQLFNATGTNNGSPFVYYSAPLAVGQSVNLLLQYSPRGFFPFTNGQLQAFAVPLPNWTPPAESSTSTNLNITRIVTLTNGNMLIEWPAITNRTYTVVYSDNVLFSNAMIAPPSIAAPANEVQWIDYGPPATTSAPTSSSARFYRVLLNQ
jgi:uncharacterized repeat protein (TIGR01451 family)